MRRESIEIKSFLENLISGWQENDETAFFPENLVSFYHSSAGCAVRALKIVFSNRFLRIFENISLIVQILYHKLLVCGS